jgi:dipeptidyl aminopeptidase/acylaminoacyl peptidase
VGPLRSAARALDADRIALVGLSAGGHLALVAAAKRTVAAVVAIGAPTILSHADTPPLGAIDAGRLLLDSTAEHAAANASPITYVAADYPPAFLLHGGADESIPCSAAIAMYNALVDAGASAELHVFAKESHTFFTQPDFFERCLSEVVHFLHRAFR